MICVSFFWFICFQCVAWLTILLHVQMEPKQDIVYSRERTKSVARSHWMIGTSNDERDSEYVPPGTRTPTLAARITRGIPQKVDSGIVTASNLMSSAHWPTHVWVCLGFWRTVWLWSRFRVKVGPIYGVEWVNCLQFWITWNYSPWGAYLRSFVWWGSKFGFCFGT